MIFRFNHSQVYDRDKFIERDFNGNLKEYTLLKFCRKPGFEEVNKPKRKIFSPSLSLDKSLSRSKRNIRDIALCNNFEYFFTQTVSSSAPCNREDLEDVVRLLKKSFKAYQRINKDFKYVIIYERHKDGKGVHLHGLLKGLGNDLYINKNGYLSLKRLENIGFNSLSKIKDVIKCSNYITKYITKNMCRTANNQVYFCSRGLIRSKVSNIDFDVDKYELVYYNEYCKKYILKKECSK